MDEHFEHDLHNYNKILELWQAENPIKTIKLQFLLATNAMLTGFFVLTSSGATLVATTGVVLNIIWTLSIGRTSLFQKAWKIKLDEIALRNRDDARFQILEIKDTTTSAPGWLRFLGGVSSRYYLTGAPVGLTLAWILISLLTL